MLIDRAATFRGKVIDRGVSASSGGFPQFVLSLVATEIYDADEQVWVDWTDMAENEITAYCILIGSKGETLTYSQIKKVFNWDGADFQVLSEGDYSEVGVQFRVEESTYVNPDTGISKTSLKVQWIDEFDAEPGRTVKKLDAGELKKLTAQYASMLKASATKAAPAKAPAKGTVTAKGKKPTSPKGPVKKTPKKTAAPVDVTPDVSTPPPMTQVKGPPPTVDVPNMPAGSCTKQEAWDEVVGLKRDDVDDQGISETWVATIIEVTGKPEQDSVTDEQWFQIKDAVNAKTAQF